MRTLPVFRGFDENRLLTVSQECAAILEVAFFDAGSFDHLDDSCANAIPRAPYATKLP